MPLCCRSNWVAPIQRPTMTLTAPSPPQQIPKIPSSPSKYIVRLNINCQNYDLMLFFYRLLFEKCPNYSKKDFSLFVLSQHRYQLDQASRVGQSAGAAAAAVTSPGSPSHSADEVTVEFQISLKNDDTNARVVERLANSYLVYNVDDRHTFENIIQLLDGFVEPIVPGKFYSVLDPDHNRVYIIDRSSPFDGFTHTLFHSCMSSLATSVGLGSKYFAMLSPSNHLSLSASSSLSSKFNSQCFLAPPTASSSNSKVANSASGTQPTTGATTIANNYSPNSNCSSCSSSETSSFDSGKDSGNWSGSTAGNGTSSSTLTNPKVGAIKSPTSPSSVQLNTNNQLNSTASNIGTGLYSKRF